MLEMPQINPYLPRDALGQGSIEPLLVRVLREWSDRWIADSRVSATAIYQDDWPSSARGVKWRSSAGVASIALADPTQWNLAAALLGSPVAQGALQPTDRRIIEDLVTLVVDDLLRRLEFAVDGGAEELRSPIPIDLGECQWWQVTLGPANRSFNLAVATPALVRMLKGELPVRANKPLKSVDTGLGRQPIEIAVQLGGCSVTLNEIQGLGLGDILVLDCLAEDPMDVLINGSRTSFRCMIDELEGRALLKLTAKEPAHV